jgi:uncharacterized membrane protein YkvA (DUF1232 family)
MIKKLISFSKRAKKQLKMYRLLLSDRRTPLISKLFLLVALGYLAMPFDIIPDFIPILGQLDDIIIIPIFIYIALKFIPKDIIKEYKLNTGLIV